MESSSQETKTSSQTNHGTSLSALIDAIALQEQCFEQSLASQQIWSQQLADTQEAKIKVAVQKTTVGAAEVNEILKGENIVASEVKTEEEFNSERGSKEWEPQLQPPSQHFSRSKSRSEVYEEHRRYSPRDHVSKKDLGNFNSHTRFDHYKDRQRSSHRENICPSGDRRLHAYRRSSSIERSWKRERRSPSKSKTQKYCHEDSHSPRSGSFRCQSGERIGRNYDRVCRNPVDDSIPQYRRSIDSKKHREKRGASPLERSWKRERRSPSKSEPRRYCHEDSHSPRSGSFRCQSGYSRGKNHLRVSRSPVDDSIPHNRRSIDSRKHRERGGASTLEIGRSHKSRDFLAEDCNNDQGDYCDEKISEPTGTRSGSQSMQTVHGNSRNYATSETLNEKAPCLASVCVSKMKLGRKHDKLL